MNDINNLKLLLKDKLIRMFLNDVDEGFYVYVEDIIPLSGDTLFIVRSYDYEYQDNKYPGFEIYKLSNIEELQYFPSDAEEE